MVYRATRFLERRRVPLTVLLIAIAVLAGPGVDRTSVASSGSYLTFSGTTALPGVVLPAGEYVFERASQDNSGDVIRVTSRKLSRVYYMGHTRPVRRPNRVDAYKLNIVFGEAAPGQPVPIRVWYPIGSDVGHEFVW